MSLLETLAANGFTAEDLEKAASARLFEEACENEGIDLDALSDDEVEQLYEAFLTDDSEKTASAAEVEEAHAKLAEAEILGRYMAQAFADEQEKIAEGYVSTKRPRMGRKRREAALARRAALRNTPDFEFGGARATPANRGRAAVEAGRAVGDWVRRNPGKTGLLGLGAGGAAAGGAYLAGRGHSKRSSAWDLDDLIDELAEARAYELLEVAGYDFE